jgi:hypothetical protein
MLFQHLGCTNGQIALRKLANILRLDEKHETGTSLRGVASGSHCDASYLTQMFETQEPKAKARAIRRLRRKIDSYMAEQQRHQNCDLQSALLISFHRFDTNADGDLHLEEFHNGLRQVL